MSGLRQTQDRGARGFTLLVTWAIKLVGLASAFNQLLLHSDPKAFPLAIAAFMMAGGQLSEGLIMAFLDRLLVVPPPPTPPAPAPAVSAEKDASR